MLQSYVLSSILTLSLTYSWYSYYGVQFVLKSKFFEPEEKPRLKPSHVVPIYMWDIYNNGVNSSEVDTVKGIHPIYVGSAHNSRWFRNHQRKQLLFSVPETKQEEVLVKAEVRITANPQRNRTTCFQIYFKSDKWIFLDEKKISGDEMTWISLHLTPMEKILKPGSVVNFLILTLFEKWGANCCETAFLHPVLLLSYISRNYRRSLKREKRNLNLEDYEEETNRIWRDGIMSQEVSEIPERKRNGCRRKSLYIKFSEIDYDNWIVAPSGYEVCPELLGRTKQNKMYVDNIYTNIAKVC